MMYIHQLVERNRDDVFALLKPHLHIAPDVREWISTPTPYATVPATAPSDAVCTSPHNRFSRERRVRAAPRSMSSTRENMATANRRPDVMAYRTVGTMPQTTNETKQATLRERGDASLAFCSCSPLAEADELLRYSEMPMTNSVSMIISSAVR